MMAGLNTSRHATTQHTDQLAPAHGPRSASQSRSPTCMLPRGHRSDTSSSRPSWPVTSGQSLFRSAAKCPETSGLSGEEGQVGHIQHAVSRCFATGCLAHTMHPSPPPHTHATDLCCPWTTAGTAALVLIDMSWPAVLTRSNLRVAQAEAGHKLNCGRLGSTLMYACMHHTRVRMPQHTSHQC
jgi:hypothetical protein